MEINFTFTREDYLHFAQFLARRNRRADLKQTGLLFGVLFACYFVLFLVGKVSAAFAAMMAALLAAACIGALRWTRARRMKSVPDKFLGERMVRIDLEGVFGHFTNTEILNRWSGITDIAEDEHLMVIFTGKSNGHVVPKRVFSTASDLKTFARSHWMPTQQR